MKLEMNYENVMAWLGTLDDEKLVKLWNEAYFLDLLMMHDLPIHKNTSRAAVMRECRRYGDERACELIHECDGDDGMLFESDYFICDDYHLHFFSDLYRYIDEDRMDTLARAITNYWHCRDVDFSYIKDAFDID